MHRAAATPPDTPATSGTCCATPSAMLPSPLTVMPCATSTRAPAWTTHDAGRDTAGNSEDASATGESTNAVAAMPSLHASFALITPLFFMQWVRRRWVKAVMLLFPVTMLTSLVYLGEHWVIDGLVGWAITVGAFWFWDWREQATRDRRAAAALAELPADEGPAEVADVELAPV